MPSPSNNTSKNQTILTPKWLVERLHAFFPEGFTDPCTTSENPTGAMYFFAADRGENGLQWTWSNNVYINPPFNDIRPWVQAAVRHATSQGACVLMLLPVRSHTQWFHDLVHEGYPICFLRERLKFEGHKAGHPEPMMLAVLGECGFGLEKLTEDLGTEMHITGTYWGDDVYYG
jgi:site-specific DNA-methyltransferase (adenine-specific)